MDVADKDSQRDNVRKKEEQLNHTIMKLTEENAKLSKHLSDHHDRNSRYTYVPPLCSLLHLKKPTGKRWQSERAL
jgi:hypothetical protein